MSGDSNRNIKVKNHSTSAIYRWCWQFNNSVGGVSSGSRNSKKSINWCPKSNNKQYSSSNAQAQ